MGLLIAEYRKIVTLRFWWALLIAPLVIGVFASAISAGAADAADEVDPNFRTGLASVGLYVAIYMIVIFSALFGAINTGTEFRHKTLTPTFLTSSGRDGVIGTKLLVTALFGLAYGLVVEVVSVVCMLLFGGDQFELNSTLFKVLLVSLLAVVCWALIGGGLGLLLASPIGAAIALVVWYLVGEWIFAAILAGIGLESAGLHLPFFSTIGTVAAGQLDGESDWPDFAISFPTLLLWTVLTVALGWYMTRKRDVT